MQDKTGYRKYIDVSEKDLEKVVQEVLELFPDIRIYAFYGQLGAGKTTLIKTFCRHLGVNHGMSSPTFSLINEYQNDKGDKIYHFDFYRIKNEREALDIGVNEYFHSGSWCFVEWPENIGHLLPDKYLKLQITPQDKEYRTIEIQLHG